MTPVTTLETGTAAPAGVRPRIESIDVLRGVIMILMALDHTRDFFGFPANPVDLSTASAPLFMTRWITHFCAPVFFLLMGTGAFLSGKSGSRKTTRDLSWFLFTRGVWLVVLEVTIARCLAYQFNFDYQVTMLLVIWALGWSLVALSALVWLPVPVITGIGAIMIAGHNLLDGVQLANPLWSILHSPGFVSSDPAHTVFVAYPLIPWIGVTAVGYGLGQIYLWPAERRRRILLRLGLALTAAFLVLRGINIYGDPLAWSQQPAALFSVLSFMNTNKYPPSLLFLLMTIGPALLFLRAVDGGTPRFLRPAVAIGRVPMFYYVLHFALIHLLAVIVCLVRYGDAHWMFESPNLGAYPFTQPPGWGYSLPIVYVVWITVVVAMYPVCRWFAAVKKRNRDVWWYSYL